MLKKAAFLGMAAAAMLWSGSALAHGCHYGPFNGPYIGVNVGYAGLESEQSPLGVGKLSSDDGGAIVGGHVGYNMQCGRVVVGVEGDLSYLDVESMSSDPAPGLATYTTKVDAMATLRGRLGITIHDNTLLYATAGVAWADRTHHLVDPGAPGGLFSQSDSEWATGYVIGGGIEFMRSERWSLRAEVLWADLGDTDRTYTVSTTGCGGTVCQTNVKWGDEVVTARIGLSLKLGGDPAPRYEPLK